MLKKLLFVFIVIVLSVGFNFAKTNIDSSVFGDIKARNIGPAVMSGRITDIAVYEKDINIIYIGTASGGVWKSTDMGITFKPIFDKYTMSIGCITVDQKDSNVLWVGTGETNVRNSVSVGTGLYKTLDGGKNWEFIGFKDSERISKIIIDSKNNNTIYVGVTGHLWDSNKERGVYKTIDGGKSWTKILYTNKNSGCIDLDMDPKNPNILYASMWAFRRKAYFFTSGGTGSGLYKTSDGGKTWNKLVKGLPKGKLGRIELDVSLSNPEILYAIVEAKKTKLYKSSNKGETWTVTGTSFGVKMRPFYLANIKIDPKKPSRIYNPSFNLSISNNSGKSFETSMMSFMGMTVHPDDHAIWINPDNPKHILLGTDGGVYVSYNRARTFRFLTNIPVSQFYHISYDMESPYNVYGGLQDNNSWYGPSSKINSTYITNKDWEKLGGGDGFYVFRDPTDKNIIYYSWQGGMFMRYNEKSAETANIRPLQSEGEPKLRYNWNAAFALSPNNPKTIYAGAQFLYKSNDRGNIWEKISPDLTTNDKSKLKQSKSGGLTIDNTGAENYCSIVAVAESPLDEKVIWVGTDDGNLQITKNGGQTWNNVVRKIKKLPKNTWCPAVEPSHFKKERVYVVFDGHRNGDKRPYVFMSNDYGKTWISLVNNDIEGYCHVIREDIKNPNLLFLGTEFGLFVSFNMGKDWVHFKETLPKVGIRDIKIHPRENDLILGTHGRGIYILDDITSLRHINTAMFEKDVVILPSRPNNLSLPVMNSNSGGDSEFFGENKKSGAVITYYLKKRHIFGSFKIEIISPEGKIIETLPTGKRRGINRVYWNMSLKAPKTAPSPGLSGLVFAGPQVKPGTYKIRLTKNSKKYESKLEIYPDRYSQHSKEERLLREKKVWQTYNMLEDIALVSKRIKKIVKIIDSKLKVGKLKKRVKKELKGDKKVLKRILANIVSKEGSFYTNEKLQGNLIEIYSAVITYGGAPTQSQVKYIDNLQNKLNKIRGKLKPLIKKYCKTE